jgi:hypothetical protein
MPREIIQRNSSTIIGKLVKLTRREFEIWNEESSNH